MEQNLSLIAKKVRSLMRVVFFILKKGISKAIFMADLNLMMKRGKLVGKSLQNLLFHHHHNWAATIFHHRHQQPHQLPFPTTFSGEYEFSCSDTPPYPLSLFTTRKKHQSKHHLDATPHMPPSPPPPPLDGSDDVVIKDTIMKALEMLTNASASPALPGFGKSPVVKQLRVTDSPFPLTNDEGDGQVDEAADKFILRFYKDLRRQN